MPFQRVQKLALLKPIKSSKKWWKHPSALFCREQPQDVGGAVTCFDIFQRLKVRLVSICQLDVSYSHLGRGTVGWGITSIRRGRWAWTEVLGCVRKQTKQAMRVNQQATFLHGYSLCSDPDWIPALSPLGDWLWPGRVKPDTVPTSLPCFILFPPFQCFITGAKPNKDKSYHFLREEQTPILNRMI